MSNKVYCKASITIEAVFLFPILLFVIFAFMYIGLYFCDQIGIDTKIQSTAIEQEQKIHHMVDEHTGMILYDKISVKGLENLLYDYDVEQAAIIHNLKETESTMFQGRVKNWIVKIETGKIEISVDSEILFLTKALQDYLPQSNRSNKHYVKMMVHNPEEFVRVYTVLDEVAEQMEQGS